MFDLGLVLTLVVLLPGYKLGQSLIFQGDRSEHRLKQYLRSMLIPVILVSGLTLQWVHTGRAFSSLGLDPPITVAAVAGLGLALCILMGLAVTIIVRPQRHGPSGQETPAKKIMPQTRVELIVFAAFSLVLGCGWEILYRGYLLWFLPARLGLPASVFIAALAYGLAHGFKNAKMFAGSLVSAFVFTIAFAVTRNLWWLMIVHCGLPLLGAFAFHRQQASKLPAAHSTAAAVELAAP